jgi:hypothetical protein
MLTPPRSAEKLMRELSIDPVDPTNAPAAALDYETRSDYFTYLDHIISASYRDPPVPSAPLVPPKDQNEPLFLGDEEEDDIQIGDDNRMVSSPSLQS